MTLTTDREEFEQWAELACELPWGFLAKRRKDSGEYADSTYEDMWKAWVAGREALANREAQPVLYASEETLAYAKEGEKSLVTWSEPMGDAVIPLYTSPPAPAVVNGRTAEGWMAEALLQKKIADDIRKSAPAVPDDVQHLKNVQELYHSQEERLFTLAQRIKGASFDKYSHTTAQAIDVLEREIFGDDGDACRAAMLAAAPEGGN